MRDPQDFLKCPNCHRSRTVKMSMHLDGDVSIKCEACEEVAIANPLNQSERVYDASQKGSYTR